MIMEPHKKQIITTGGAGYNASLDTDLLRKQLESHYYNYATGNLPIDTIRMRLYRNLWPYGYNDPIERVHNAVVQNQQDHRFKKTGDTHLSPRDVIFATYLQIPKNLRRHTSYPTVLQQSDYKPTLGDIDKTYYKLPELTNTEKVGLIKDAQGLRYLARDENGHYYVRGRDTDRKLDLNFGQNKVSRVLGDLGSHTIGRGVDPQKGEYISYYDLWDLSPFGMDKQNVSDQSMGIGKPVEFYDRLYLDDFYGADSSTRGYPRGTRYGGWLPEITIRPRQTKQK